MWLVVCEIKINFSVIKKKFKNYKKEKNLMNLFYDLMSQLLMFYNFIEKI